MKSIEFHEISSERLISALFFLENITYFVLLKFCINAIFAVIWKYFPMNTKINHSFINNTQNKGHFAIIDIEEKIAAIVHKMTLILPIDYTRVMEILITCPKLFVVLLESCVQLLPIDLCMF